MVEVCWVWSVLGFLVCVASQYNLPSNHPGLKATEILIDRNVCGGTGISVGTPYNNWKRLRFPADSLSRCIDMRYQCKLEFRLEMENAHGATEICVEYSAMKIDGEVSSVLIQKSPGDTLLQLISEKSYLKVEKYMLSTVCMKQDEPGDRLTVTFRTSCNTPLDQRFQGWMYVYTQSPDTGTVYFVDGGSQLRHNLLSIGPGNRKVSIRSHVWPDVPRSGEQLSTLRVLVDSNLICIEWNPYVTPTMPRGMSLKIFRMSNKDRTPLSYLTLYAGQRVKSPSAHPQCCFSQQEYHQMVFEVTRDTNVRLDQPSWNKTKLLLDLIVGANNRGDLVYGNPEGEGDSRDAPAGGNCQCDYIPSLCSDDDQLSFWEEHKLKLFLALGASVLLVLIYCCCCKGACKQEGKRLASV